MDIATILGMILGVGLVLSSIAMGAGGLAPFMNVPSVMITLGGSVAALLINFPLNRVLGVFGIVKNCFLHRLPTPEDVIEQFKRLTNIARKDGILALEQSLDKIEDRFMRRGLEMVIAGTSRADIQYVLETELNCIDERHRTGKKIIDALGAAAPAFGMIGTLIGLVQMLRTLDDPSQIGGGMATALLTTLYGACIANLFCIPLAGKLETRNSEEMLIGELTISGLALLAEGESPRTIEERLVSYMSQQGREKTRKAA